MGNLGVEHKGTEDAGVVHGGAEIAEGLVVVFVGTMGEVETGDVHAGPEKLLQHGNGAGSGTQSANDLGLGPPLVSLVIHLHFCLLCVRVFSEWIKSKLTLTLLLFFFLTLNSHS